MRNILITGSTGFIGSHLADACLKKKYRVRALVMRGDPGEVGLKKQRVEIVYGDLRDGPSLEAACKGVDIVFHCAAVVTDWAPRSLFQAVNIDGMEKLCRAALNARVQRFVELSTNDVFGLDESRVITEEAPLKKWGEPYADTKIAAEEIAWRYYQAHGLPVTMVYPCWVYGPGDKTFVPLTADAILKKEMVFWRKDVHVWPTYVDNLVDLLMTISMHKNAVGKGFLVHDGEMTTFQQFCGAIAAALGAKAPRLHLPYFVAYGAALLMEFTWRILRLRSRPLLTTYTVKNLGSRLRFSIERAERELGWTPKISYRESLARTLEWLKGLDRSNLKQK